MPANLSNIRENIRNIENELAQERQRARDLVADPNASVDAMTAQADTIAQLTARLDLARLDVQDEERERGERVSAQHGRRAQASDDAPARSEALQQILASREYARAFALAIRSGISVMAGRGDERLGVLYNALTEAGGTPEGSDGGFLVPEAVDYQIREQRRQLITLSSLFDVQTVNTNKGSYPKDIAPTAGFTKLDGEIPSGGIPMDDQPKFANVPFTLDTYGLNIPISNELLADEVSGLFNYLSRFFARKHVLTENKLLLAMLDKLVAVDFTPDASMNALGKIKNVLNVALDPEISTNAAILTNQSGFDYLDQMEDVMGRPLLQPDPTTGTPMLLKTRPVVVASDKQLKNPSGDKLPFYIGDFEQYGTLFMRQNLEIASTNVGGNAWRSNSTEVRGITRLGTAVSDEEAAVRLTIAVDGE